MMEAMCQKTLKEIFYFWYCLHGSGMSQNEKNICLEFYKQRGWVFFDETSMISNKVLIEKCSLKYFWRCKPHNVEYFSSAKIHY